MPDYEQNTGSVRFRYRDIGGAFAQYISAAPAIPLSHEKLTVGVIPTPLPNVPVETRRMFLTSLGQDIEFRDDGVAPNGSNGYPIPANTHFVYDNEITDDFQIVRSASATGDADVRIAYYG